MVWGEYKVVLKHDKGNSSFTLLAQDEQTAITTVLAVENAPKNSVVSVSKLKEINY